MLLNCRSSSKKARDLWWLGIPPSVRGKVWKLAIGNDLNLTSGKSEARVTYNLHMHRVKYSLLPMYRMIISNENKMSSEKMADYTAIFFSFLNGGPCYVDRGNKKKNNRGYASIFFFLHIIS